MAQSVHGSLRHLARVKEPRTGKKHALRVSGIYPAEFCEEIAGKIHTHIAAALNLILDI